MRCALTIAGSDSGGGAGIQADLKTFAAHHLYGASVITAVTAQNTLGVRESYPLPPEIVAAQLSAVLEDLHPAAIKIGMLGNGDIVRTVSRVLAQYPSRWCWIPSCCPPPDTPYWIRREYPPWSSFCFHGQL